MWHHSQNVFLGTKGDVRLGDFGVSKLLESTSDLARTKVGTPYFMSPELCESRPYSSKSDIWALGCLLYEMVALRPPFEADNIASLVLRIIRGQYDPVCGTYSSDVAWIVKHCCESIQVSVAGCTSITVQLSRSRAHCPVATHAVSLRPESRPSAAQLLDVPSIRRRALLLEVVDVLPATDTVDVGPRTPPNTPPRTADPNVQAQWQTPDGRRRSASTQPRADAEDSAGKTVRVQRQRRAVSASSAAGAGSTLRETERYQAPIDRDKRRKGTRAPGQELERAEMFNAEHPPQPVRLRRSPASATQAAGTRPSSRVRSDQKPQRASSVHNAEPSSQPVHTSRRGLGPTVALLEGGSHGIDRTDSTEAQPSSSVRGGAKAALLQRCDDVHGPRPLRRVQRRFSTPPAVTTEQARLEQQPAALAATDTAFHPESHTEQRAQQPSPTQPEAGSKAKVALSGVELGSWVSARACRPIVQTPVPKQSLRTVSPPRGHRRSPVFSPDSFGAPCNTADDIFGEPIELKPDERDVDQERIQSELRALRRKAVVEGGLSEAQLESLLDYLRTGPKSPTRAEEEATMAYIAGVLPLEKMTVVTTMFKIIYKQEAMAVAR